MVTGSFGPIERIFVSWHQVPEAMEEGARLLDSGLITPKHYVQFGWEYNRVHYGFQMRRHFNTYQTIQKEGLEGVLIQASGGRLTGFVPDDELVGVLKMTDDWNDLSIKAQNTLIRPLEEYAFKISDNEFRRVPMKVAVGSLANRHVDNLRDWTTEGFVPLK